MHLLGWEIILSAFAVVILGGIGSFYGAIIAAYINREDITGTKPFEIVRKDLRQR